MNSLYTLALRQSASLSSDVKQLDSLSSPSPSPAPTPTPRPPPSSALHGQINASLAAFDRTIDDYDSMARREIVDAKREKALARVARFRDELAELRKEYDRVKLRARQAVRPPLPVCPSLSRDLAHVLDTRARAPAGNGLEPLRALRVLLHLLCRPVLLRLRLRLRLCLVLLLPRLRLVDLAPLGASPPGRLDPHGRPLGLVQCGRDGRRLRRVGAQQRADEPRAEGARLCAADRGDARCVLGPGAGCAGQPGEPEGRHEGCAALSTVLPLVSGHRQHFQGTRTTDGSRTLTTHAAHRDAAPAPQRSQHARPEPVHHHLHRAAHKGGLLHPRRRRTAHARGVLDDPAVLWVNGGLAWARRGGREVGSCVGRRGVDALHTLLCASDTAQREI